MRKLLLAAMTACALMAGATTAYADTTEVVLPGDPDWHEADTRAPGTGGQEEGPASPPLGTGSFELRTPATPGPNTGLAKVQYFTDDYDGTRLDTIDGIGYSSYLETPPGVAMVALNMRVDLNGDGSPDRYMVFEPYQDQGNAAVQVGVWQSWDAYRGGAAKWWLSGDPTCGQATPCTWNQILALYPNATIEEGTSCGPAGVKTPCPGSLGLNQGSGNPGVVSNADALYVSVNGERTTYDFELTPPMPSTKDDCKNGGWQSYGTTFRNQGDCVAFVASRGKNAPGN